MIVAFISHYNTITIHMLYKKVKTILYQEKANQINKPVAYIFRNRFIIVKLSLFECNSSYNELKQEIMMLK